MRNHAYRAFRENGGDVENLPEAFVSALEINANDHMLMQAAIQPYICASISKTVNVPGDYPFTQFKELYVDAWKHGLKGITTYRPNEVLGSVLSVESAAPVAAEACQTGSGSIRAGPKNSYYRYTGGGAGGVALVAPSQYRRRYSVCHLRH